MNHRPQYTKVKSEIQYVLFFIFSLFSIIRSQDPFVIDLSLSSSMPQTLANSIELADVNNDGFTDIILSGYDSTRFGLYIDIRLGSSDVALSQGYQTNFITYPDTIAEYLGGIGNMSLADVNLDGSIDLYINGSARSKLLFNSSSGSFSESSWLQNMSVTYSDGKWGDVNMDGAPDLFVMGVDEYEDIILNELFINNGSYLEEDPATIFPSLFSGSSAWGDYDNDGDPDLIIGGRTANPISSVTRLYQNDPIGRLTEVITADAINGLKAGVFHFADLDADGDDDLIMSGWNRDNGMITSIYNNQLSGNFVLFDQQIDDFAAAYGSIDAIDYNLDGLKDLVIAGADSVTHHAGKVHSLSGRVYLNNGDGTFAIIKEIPGVRVARFLDVNQDGIPDLVTNGTTEIGNFDSTFSHVYLNTHSGVNDSPDPPDALTAFAVSTRAIFTWGSGSDDIDEPAGLSYNIRIGTSPGGNQLMSSAVPYNDSNVGRRLIREFNEIPHGTYYWAVQTVDGSGNTSDWSQEDTLLISRLVTSNQSLPGVYFSTAGWADYNEDNYLDLALAGITFSGSSIATLFENLDGMLSQDLTQNIEAVFGGHLTWVDYTNDGHLDLSISGFQIINFQGFPATAFYKWENGTYIFDPQDNVTTSYYGYTMGINGGSNNHSWGDYDNDGDLDFVIGGIDYGGGKHLKVFQNENGTLIQDTTQTELVPIFPCITHWVDLNLDGYLDLITIGSDSVQSLGLRVYLNNSNHILTPSTTWESEIFGVTAGAIAFADYNDDGYDDFALTGLNSGGDLISYIVTNAINTFIVSGGHMLTGVYYGRPTWGDYDSDGDWDLLVSGLSSTADGGSIPFTGLYAQDNGVFTIDGDIDIDSVGYSFSQFGDYDADGDLDLFMTGITSNSDVSARIYDNLEGLENPNKAPDAPYLLQKDDVDIHDDRITLTWSAPVDPANAYGGSTSELGLRYQIQVGHEDGSNDHVISTGHYGIGEIGTINTTQRILQNLPDGNYRWRVRAIDQGYAASEWSNWDYFEIKAYRTVYPGDADNNGMVNELDILPIGIYFHEMGPQRDNISYNWDGIYVEPWNIPDATYADANGDGVIDQLDVVAIGVNWSNLHENGAVSYSGISLEDQDIIDQNMDNYIEIYNSLSGSGIAVDRMRALLETIISSEVPLEYSLKQNYPNPFNPMTTLRYDLPEDALVNITIYDMMGREVSNLVSSQQKAGYKSAVWNAINNAGQSVSAGLYLYTIHAGEFSQTRKMMLLK
jgi:hypothetical protein